MKVVEAPPIRFRCACGALNEGAPSEFRPLPTNPPSFRATCGFCHCESTVFPTALIAQAAGALLGAPR